MGTNLKTIVLHGSPRKSGNSDTLAKYFLKGLGEAGDHQVEHFYTNEMNIRPCQGCLTCETAVGHRCAIVDDMESIYSAFTDADIVVWATPMYWGYMTAQLKTALDRMESLVMRDGFRGKTFVVLITCSAQYATANKGYPTPLTGPLPPYESTMSRPGRWSN